MTSKNRSWPLWGAGLALAASVAGAVLYFDLGRMAEATPAAAAPAAPPAIPVTVAAIAPSSVTTWQEFSGRLEAVDRVQIRPRVAGTIQQVHFREGGLVAAGDRLITIDPAPYAAAVAQAEGLAASARARLELATTELDRGNALLSRKTISESEVAQRKGAQREALAALQSAEAALKLAQLDLDYTEIKAPIAGRVGRLEVTPGNLVGSGDAAQPLTTLVSVDPIYASFDAGEELVATVLAELPVKDDGVRALENVPVEIATLADGAAVRGKLQLVDNEVNAASGTIRLRAVFALNVSSDPNLAAQRFPMHHKRCLACAIQFLRFGTAVICVKHKRRILDVFQRHHAGIWHAVPVHRRQRDGIGVIWLALLGLSQPRPCNIKRVLARKNP